MRVKIENELLPLGISAVLLGVIVFLIPLPELLPLQALLALLFIFFIPGYCLLVILAPRKDDLSIVERLGISVGISFAGVPFFWLIFNYTPFGITPQTMFFSLAIIVLILIYIAWQRRKRIPKSERFVIEFTINIPKNNLDKSLDVFLIASIMLGFASMGYSIFNPPTEEKTTQFYILGSAGIASDYPRDLLGGSEANVTVGIINNEGKNVDYRIVSSINESTIESEWFVSLKDGERTEEALEITPPLTNEDTTMKIEFVLYLVGRSEPYRSVYFWSDVHSLLSNFTAFYFVKQPDTFLGALELGQPVSVKLGIDNHEHKTMTYRVDISAEFPISEPIGFEVTLNQGERAERELTFVPQTLSFYPKQLYFNLHEMGAPQNIYKQLRVDLNTAE